MLRFLPYILKGLWRHRTRSLLTISGAMVGLFVFCFVGAVHQGLDSLVQDREAEHTLLVFQENRFCPTTSRLPQDYKQAISGVPGVADVLPILVFTNNCRASLDVIVFHGLPAEQLPTARRLELASGDWSDFQENQASALVGWSVAKRRGLKVGDPFSVGEITVKVAGVFRSAVAAEDNLIFCHLEFLQRAPGMNAVGLVTQFETHLADGANLEAVAAAIDEKLHSGPVATATRRKSAFQASTLGDLVDLINSAQWLGYASVVLVLSLVATTTVMAVQDRVGEHALLQTLGLRPARVFQLVVVESLLLCVIGGLTGTALALGVLASSGLAMAAEAVTLTFQPSLRLAVAGAAVSFVVGLLASLVPAWQAARVNIVSALRRSC
ncbi:MAG: ABC transporter permease [Thermoguttaceae bacterium]|jgi:putative ABC transport system permease protein